MDMVYTWSMCTVQSDHSVLGRKWSFFVVTLLHKNCTELIHKYAGGFRCIILYAKQYYFVIFIHTCISVFATHKTPSVYLGYSRGSHDEKEYDCMIITITVKLCKDT